MKKFMFNTERSYSSIGQIIKVRVLRNGQIVFNDLTRDIRGMTPSILEEAETLEDYSQTDVERFLMICYDDNIYTHTTERV